MKATVAIPKPEATQYRIDAEGVISSVGGIWDAFALANNAPQLVAASVVGRPLWNYIADATTTELYRRIFERVRKGRHLTVQFRCDAPDARRFMELQMHPEPHDIVRCEAVTVRIESRRSVMLLDERAVRTDSILRMCGWCKRIPVGFKWLEVEEAVAALGLFDTVGLPRISHGICPRCEADAMRVAA